MKIAFFLLIVLSSMVVAEPKSSIHENTGKDVLVGGNYFAGWWRDFPNKWHGQGWRIGQPDWRPGFPERVPTLGESNEQASMDREIIVASDHGVDFFAILWYYPKPDTAECKNAPLLNRGLAQFIASPEAQRMKFFIEYCNSPRFSADTDEQWTQCIPVWVEAMKHPSYLRVDKRLLFKVHGITDFLRHTLLSFSVSLLTAARGAEATKPKVNLTLADEVITEKCHP